VGEEENWMADRRGAQHFPLRAGLACWMEGEKAQKRGEEKEEGTCKVIGTLLT
jgi:hypothetical protein